MCEKHCPLLSLHNTTKHLNGDSMKGGVQASKFTFSSNFFQLNLCSFFICFPGLLPSQQISKGVLGRHSTAKKKKKSYILDLLAGKIYFPMGSKKELILFKRL